MKSLILLWIGISLSVLTYLATILFELDLFERFVEILTLFEAYEFDEVIIPVLILGFFSTLYVVQLRRETFLEKEKSKIYVATLSSSYHIIQDFLNNMEELRTQMKSISHLDPTYIKDLDKNIKKVIALLDKLSHIEKIDEQVIKKTVGIRFF